MFLSFSLFFEDMNIRQFAFEVALTLIKSMVIFHTLDCQIEAEIRKDKIFNFLQKIL